MSNRRAIGGVLSILLAVGLSGCTAGVADHWRVADNGELSFASCEQFTIDTLTVSTRADDGNGSYRVLQEFEVSGPEVFFDDGETLDLDAVAQGWSAPQPLDMTADWQEVTLEGTINGNPSFWTSADRDELPLGEWIQLPQSGLGLVSCDRI